MTDEERKEISKPFWEKGSDNIIDIDAFHKAYDDEFTDEVKALFNREGLLYSKSSWGVIKDLNQDLWSTKAIRRLWGLQFKNNAKTQKQLDEEARRKAEAEEYERQKKAREEERARQQAEQSKIVNDQFIPLLDTPLINKVIELMGRVGKKYQFPYFITSDYNSGYYIGNGRYYPESQVTTEKAAEYINQKYADLLPIAEIYAKELEAQEYYKDCDWFNSAYKFISSKAGRPAENYYYTFQDKEGKIYKTSFDKWDDDYDTPRLLFFTRLKDQGMPLDAKLVIVELATEEINCHNEREYYRYYVSVSKDASKAAFEMANVDLSIEETPRDKAYEQWWSFSGYKEVEAKHADHSNLYIKEGMDKWYTATKHCFSTF